jgi:hypothetical protein
MSSISEDCLTDVFPGQTCFVGVRLLARLLRIEKENFFHCVDSGGDQAEVTNLKDTDEFDRVELCLTKLPWHGYLTFLLGAAGVPSVPSST